MTHVRGGGAQGEGKTRRRWGEETVTAKNKQTKTQQEKRNIFTQQTKGRNNESHLARNRVTKYVHAFRAGFSPLCACFCFCCACCCFFFLTLSLSPLDGTCANALCPPPPPPDVSQGRRTPPPPIKGGDMTQDCTISITRAVKFWM